MILDDSGIFSFLDLKDFLRNYNYFSNFLYLDKNNVFLSYGAIFDQDRISRYGWLTDFDHIGNLHEKNGCLPNSSGLMSSKTVDLELWMILEHLSFGS